MRPTWDEYFMQLAALVSTRATCLRRKVGAVLVRDHHVLATGYNGAPAGVQHCAQAGCLRDALAIPSGERYEICRGAHAEINAVVLAARHGHAVAGATLYSTLSPCSCCAKALINAGVVEVCWREDYEDRLAGRLLAEAGMVVRRLDVKADGGGGKA
jgi:dCMP deaminase